MLVICRYSKENSIIDLQRMQNTNNYMPSDSMNDLSAHQAFDSSAHSYDVESSTIDSSVSHMTHTSIAKANTIDYLNNERIIRRLILIAVVTILASSINVVEGYTNRQGVRFAPKATVISDRSARYKLFSNSVSSSSSSSSKLLGKDYLPAEALTRAAGGNMFEKVKLANDPVNVWTEVSEYAAAIRSGTIDW